MVHVIRIEVQFDDEARVWFVNESTLPGLSAEADSLDQLKAKLPGMIADLIECNGLQVDDDVPIELIARETTSAKRLAAA
jgi:hypothetical protein